MDVASKGKTIVGELDNECKDCFKLKRNVSNGLGERPLLNDLQI